MDVISLNDSDARQMKTHHVLDVCYNSYIIVDSGNNPKPDYILYRYIYKWDRDNLRLMSLIKLTIAVSTSLGRSMLNISRISCCNPYSG